MQNTKPIFYFEKLSALGDFTRFEIVSGLNGGGQSWDVKGTLQSGEEWPVLTGLMTKQDAETALGLCQLASIAPAILRTLNEVPRLKLFGQFKDSYELAATLERLLKR